MPLKCLRCEETALFPAFAPHLVTVHGLDGEQARREAIQVWERTAPTRPTLADALGAINAEIAAMDTRLTALRKAAELVAGLAD